ncbi:hypothetical protein THRCLA_11737 [Thraustotheca clavata]|uniref:PSP1 C-terminal domain-containing protein n=1 Tax=Thraustotheca clavata TaxID=74557 RepID=A0A1V9Y6T3_9STRA|nr:hypothetical protein THRCLA_11737 [Thraustotheca clavata]
MHLQTPLSEFPVRPELREQDELLDNQHPLPDASAIASQKEWSDFLNKSVLALSLEEPVDEDSTNGMRPKPITTSTPTKKQLRAGSPLVLCMSPLASIPPIPSMVNSPDATNAVNSTSWPTWPASIPDNEDLEEDNNNEHSPLGIPLLSEKHQATENARRLRAKSISTIYGHEHHSTAWNSERQDGLGLSNNPPPLPHLQLPPSPYQSASNMASSMQSVSHFNTRRYSGDFDHFGHRNTLGELPQQPSFLTQPPMPIPNGTRGIRSHSMECHTSSVPRQMQSPYSMARSPVPRQGGMMRQPPLPMKNSNQFEWQRSSNDFAPPLPPDNQFSYANAPSVEFVPEAYYEVQFKRCRKDTFAGISGYKLGDYVKVEGDRGEDVGHVINITTDLKKNGSEAEGKENAPIKRIMRLASEAELNLLREQHKEEQEVLQVCRSKVRQRMLPMNVIDAEYQFDRHKLTFFFEADRRIDFRELVRDLFAIYKTRIWLQQVVSVHKKGMAPEFELADGHN